ncbi:Transcriptional regulator SlyA [Serratia plymuthica]|uniref:MarR family winged helix-turn-helix transcriptional regulator n=1 Tax=Serratia plymuthica TaxID=82996 RepID=UPI00034A9A90|nr:MarR family transcriptional regulator [Serratia plymuthica]QJW56433.1 Transcriptional regulator SlyA [Serratia plymuthica]
MQAGHWQDIGPLLFATGQSWRRLLAQRLSEEGLSDATALLVLVMRQAGRKPLRQRELAQRMGVENSAVVRLLDALETDGLVSRREDPADRRAKLPELTQEGRHLGERVDNIARALREQLLADIPSEDVAAMDRGLRLLWDALGACDARRKKP